MIQAPTTTEPSLTSVTCRRPRLAPHDIGAAVVAFGILASDHFTKKTAGSRAETRSRSHKFRFKSNKCFGLL